MQIKNNTILQWCLVATICRFAQADQSTDEISEREKAIRNFNMNLPERYLCCKGANSLKNINWRIFCIEEGTAKISNLTIGYGQKVYVEVAQVSSANLIYLVENGIVYMGSGKIRSEISSHLYCFGNRTTGPPDLLVLLNIDNIGQEEVTSELKDKAPSAGALSLVSAPFSAVVIFVYASIPKLRDLQGKSILCLCCSFLVSSLMIANEDLQILQSMRECHGGGEILYFSLMASVFWMNVICVQTFVSIRFPEKKTTWRSQFTWYSCYAWGVPTVLFLSTLATDVHSGSLVLQSMDLTFNCWTYDIPTQWKFYLAPLTATVAASFLLLLYSAVLIRRQKSETQYKPLHFEFCLALKLFLVVGITWLNEPLQILHGQQSIVWIIGDCWNLLQGVLLFLVLVLLRKRCMQAILDKYQFCSTPWLQNFTITLADDEDTSAILEENGFNNADANKDID